jgi:hypothetical protein
MTTNVPAYLARRGALSNGFDDTDFTSGIGSAQPAHLSIAGNRFTLLDDAGNERSVGELDQQRNLIFDVCIIAANNNSSRMYFDPRKPYSPDDNVPPLCWSDNGQGPSRNAMEPQSPLCAICPQAAWNSAVSKVTGRGIPACQASKKLAFIVPGDADNIIYMLKVPPASFTNWTQYVKTLRGHNLGGRPATPADVNTRISFKSQGILQFMPAGIVSEDTFNRTEAAYGDTARLITVTGRDDIPIDPQQPIRSAAIPRPMAEQPRGTGNDLQPPHRPVLPVQGEVLAPLPPNRSTNLAIGGTVAPGPARQQPPQPVWNEQAQAWEIPGQAPLQQVQEPPKPQGRGRPRKPVEAAPAPAKGGAAPLQAVTGQTIPGDPLDLPDFLNRAAAPQEAATFGIQQNAPPPPDEISGALDAAFNLSVPG